MARPQPVQQLALLETALRRYPDGATLAELAREFSPPPDTRTLERWMRMLKEQNRVCETGADETRRFVLSSTALAEAAGSATAPTAAAASGETAAAPTDRFAELFQDAVVQIVVVGMPPSQTTAMLQLQAAKERIPLEQRLSYVAYAKTRLEALKPEDMENFGITPETFAAWRRKWTAATTPSPVATPPNTVETAAAKAAPVSSAEEPEDPVVQLVPRETAPQAAGATAAAATASDADELAEILKGIGLARMVPMLKSTIELGKELFSWKRVGIAVAWGLLVMYAIQRVLPGSVNYVLQLPLTGLPWYVFLRASRRGGKKPTSREIVTAIADGGAVTAFLAGLLLPILLQIVNRSSW